MASTGGLAFFPFDLHGEIDHEDGVFLDDADQQNDADERDDVEIRFDEAEWRAARRCRRKESWKEW